MTLIMHTSPSMAKTNSQQVHAPSGCGQDPRPSAGRHHPRRRHHPGVAYHRFMSWAPDEVYADDETVASQLHQHEVCWTACIQKAGKVGQMLQRDHEIGMKS